MPARRTALAKSTRRSLTGPVIKVRITLLETQPPVWREVVLRYDTPLDRFMMILMDTMGWENCHLHELTCGRERFRPKGMISGDWDEDVSNAAKVRVEEVLPRKGSKCHWTYDFGDGWEHEIKLVERDVPWEGKLPACTDGARACPPEDCGGIPRYWNLCEAMADPKHPERDNFIDWLGEPFDPEAFDLAKLNRRL